MRWTGSPFAFAAWNHTLAEPDGFEPPIRESKSRALPLGHGPVYAAGRRISRQRLQTKSHLFAAAPRRSQAPQASATFKGLVRGERSRSAPLGALSMASPASFSLRYPRISTPSLPGCQGGFHTSTSFNVSLLSRRTYDSATSVFVLYSMVQPLEPPPGVEPGSLGLFPPQLRPRTAHLGTPSTSGRRSRTVDLVELNHAPGCLAGPASLEPPTGLEPAPSAWKAEVLPLHHGGIYRPRRGPNHAGHFPSFRAVSETR